MQVLLNSLKIGKFPKGDVPYLNIYAYVYDDVVYLEFLDHIVYNYIEPLFEERVKRATHSSQSDIDNFGFLIHFFYNKADKSIFMDSEENAWADFSEGGVNSQLPDHIRSTNERSYNEAIEAINAFMFDRENAKYFGDIGSEGVTLKDERFTPSEGKHHVYDLTNFPNAYRMLSENKVSREKMYTMFGNSSSIQIVAFKFRDKNGMFDPEITVKMVSPQIGVDYFRSGDSISFVDKPLNFFGTKVRSPFILLNDTGYTVFQMEKKIYLFLADKLGFSSIQKEKFDLYEKIRFGYDVQDLFYFKFRDTSTQHIFVSTTGKSGSVVIRDLENLTIQHPTENLDVTSQIPIDSIENSTDFYAAIIEGLITAQDENETAIVTPGDIKSSEFSRVSSLINNDQSKQAQKIKQEVDSWVKECGITDRRTVDFLKTMFVYIDMFPFTDEKNNPTKYYNKEYMSVVSIPNTGFGESHVPPDPATRNHKLFGKMFSIHGNPIVTPGRVYYLIYSRILFPESVFRMFMQDARKESCSLHEVFEYNSENKYLTKYSLVNNTPQEGAEKIAYDTKVMPQFADLLQNTEGIDVQHNLSDKRLIVRTMVDFPYAYSHVLQMFQKEQVEFRNINIIMMFDIMQSSMLGGYVFTNTENATAETRQAVQLMDGNKIVEFPAPVIVINLANREVQRRENISYVLIHECRHYLDDIMISEGKQKNIIADVPRVSETAEGDEHNKQYVNYVNSVAESRAFMQSALSVIRQHDVDYVVKNWSEIKSRILEQTFRASSYSAGAAFSKIADDALYEFLEENGRLEDAPYELERKPDEASGKVSPTPV